MPTWSGILQELTDSSEPTGVPQFDMVRRKYLGLLHEHTGRETILYATRWTQSDPNVPPELLSITDEDLQGLMEVVHGLSGTDLDLILHSPGGSLEAAEALVLYLRSQFDHIRVIVPQLAMSAATMIACAADVIAMGKHSFVGPIDPQIILNTPLGQRMVPAQAILEQFDKAVEECVDPAKLGAWLPMLSQYGPDLLVQCEHASTMSTELVRQWLAMYMFRDHPDAHAVADGIASWLSNHLHFKSHSRHIPRVELEDRGLNIEHLEDDEDLQDLALSVFHTTTHTLSATNAAKIIENHLGKAFIKHFRLIKVAPGNGPVGEVSEPQPPHGD